MAGATAAHWRPYELQTEFKLGGPIGGIYRVLGGTYPGIYHKFCPGRISPNVPEEQTARNHSAQYQCIVPLK